MSIYIVIFAAIILLFLGLGFAYFARSRRQRERVPGEEPKNGTPVTLDRNPEMPKMPGATS